jgi:hypothetical protein
MRQQSPHGEYVLTNRSAIVAAAPLRKGCALEPPHISQALDRCNPVGPAGPSGENRIFDELLARYLVQSRDRIVLVDYARWKSNAADRSGLGNFLAALAARRPSAMGRNERFAFWANFYNATTLKIVIDNYPVRSIRDIKSDTSLFDIKRYIGPWRTKIATIENQPVSLDDIEHEIMRPTFKDPRVHYSVNCASIGCPNLPLRAWRAETLDKDLDMAARAFINHPRGVWVGPDGRLRVSSIYKWFKEDFGGTDAGVLAHLRKYAGPDLLARLPAQAQGFDDDYDWSLNQVGRRG